MIRKLVRQMLTAQIFSALTVSLCLLIDNIMIGRFLKVQALAAYGLANPLLMALGAVGSMLGAGVQVVCSRSLGRGSQEETNAGYSSALALTAGISLSFMALVLLLRSPLAALLGAGRSGRLFERTRDYMAGFVIGAPASMGALVLVPFLQMAGRSGLLITAVLSMTAADVLLDLLNVLVLKWDMFGMGLASSLSYYIALAISCRYFLSKKCVFRFSRRLVTRKKTAELFTGGIPAVFSMAAAVILVFFLNRLLKNLGGSGAVAAYSVISTLGSAGCCINTGIGGVSLTLCGILFHEEDASGLRELMRLLFRYAVILGLLMGGLLMLCAPFLVSLFIPEAGAARDMAVLGLRLFAAGLIPCCMVGALKNAYQATGRVFLTAAISLAEGTVLPAAAAGVLSSFMGTAGVWFYFMLGEALALLLIGCFILHTARAWPWRNGAALLLRQDFGAAPENLMEKEIRTVQDAADAARQAEEFCLRHGQSAKISNHIALCIEEMASNTIQHGFRRDKKTHHLSVRLLRKPDQWVLRFRDDCGAFDPVHYVPSMGKDALGIRLVMALAREAAYTYSLNLNNLVLKLPADENA